MNKNSICFIEHVSRFDYADYDITSWREVKYIAKNLNEITGEDVSIKLASYSDLPKRQNIIKLNSGRDAITIKLFCNLNFVMNFMITDIVKSEVKKININKIDMTEQPYELNYCLKTNSNNISSYSFCTDSKRLIGTFAEKVSVQALPCGKIDAPSNKKLVKLNRRVLRQIKKNQF